MKLFDITNNKKYDFSCIYKFKNLINGKVYIGQTKSFGMIMTIYKGWNFNNPHFLFAVNKYGIDNFEVDIIEKDIPLELLNEREQYWIDQYESYNPKKGYNILKIAGSNRGQKAWNKGIPTDEETKQKIRAGLKRYYSTHEVWNKGVPATEEAKEKNRISNSGEKNGMFGKQHSKETKEKISNTLTGRKMPYEQRKKLFRPVRCVDTGVIYESESSAAELFGCSQTLIYYAAIGKYKTAKGHKFEYVTIEEVSTE